MEHLHDKTKNEVITTNDTQTKEEIDATQEPKDALEDVSGGVEMQPVFHTREEYFGYIKKAEMSF